MLISIKKIMHGGSSGHAVHKGELEERPNCQLEWSGVVWGRICGPEHQKRRHSDEKGLQESAQKSSGGIIQLNTKWMCGGQTIIKTGQEKKKKPTSGERTITMEW